jgi:hypothetical protein
MMAQAGQDPSDVLARIASIIEGRLKNKPIEVLVADAFAPKTPEAGVEGPVEAATPSEVPGTPPPASGQMMAEPQGMPDMNMLLAGLTSSGNANLSANVSRRIPIQ